MLRTILLVGCGGFLGAVSRYFVALRMSSALDGLRFPWAIFTVNMIGCFCIGVLASVFAAREEWSAKEGLALFLIAGFLGSFTTFSTFGLETLTLLRENRLGAAASYVGASVVVGVLLVAAGFWLGGRWVNLSG
ncbi:MAG: fluoride efflux transporter CrcB [Verrucomicrobiota bacterium]